VLQPVSRAVAGQRQTADTCLIAQLIETGNGVVSVRARAAEDRRPSWAIETVALVVKL